MRPSRGIPKRSRNCERRLTSATVASLECSVGSAVTRPSREKNGGDCPSSRTSRLGQAPPSLRHAHTFRAFLLLPLGSREKPVGRLPLYPTSFPHLQMDADRLSPSYSGELLPQS